MADLDDFFAKKDRKKSKVKKFATADELAKKMEDNKQKVDVRPKKERPAQEGDEPGRAGEEEEWKEYEEPVKDYTGLKIQVLQGGNGAPESGRDPASDSAAPDQGKQKGPWNKPTEAEQPPPPPPAADERPREPRPAAYVPPVQRVRQPEPLRRSMAKHAPDIHNDDSFPVLGAGGKRGGWSAAAAGALPSAQRQPLALGNRFTSLQDDS
ncbi:protein CDV3 homolog isoform X2 [Plodia interpunctella]|uniref:protein CDV3 homolog isoform X2 n=1 Tax=Plodia interpunctella TaxID=58824 RepID=UPI002368C722|nr:protein CDV3 homolog isoform X2 [Plodia interpunctella]